MLSRTAIFARYDIASQPSRHNSHHAAPAYRVYVFSSPVELTTAVTDVLIAALSLGIVTKLRAFVLENRWKALLWSWIFGLLALAAAAGALAHGFSWPARAVVRFQHPIFLSLGLVVALVVVASIHDFYGRETAKRILPWAVAAGLVFYVSTRFFGAAFLAFVLYEVVGMLAALILFARTWLSRGSKGAGWIVLGVALTMVAAYVQTTDISFRVVVPFDNNGSFHLVQIIALLPLFQGLRAGMGAGSERQVVEATKPTVTDPGARRGRAS